MEKHEKKLAIWGQMPQKGDLSLMYIASCDYSAHFGNAARRRLALELDARKPATGSRSDAVGHQAHPIWAPATACGSIGSSSAAGGGIGSTSSTGLDCAFSVCASNGGRSSREARPNTSRNRRVVP